MKKVIDMNQHGPVCYQWLSRNLAQNLHLWGHCAMDRPGTCGTCRSKRSAVSGRVRGSGLRSCMCSVNSWSWGPRLPRVVHRVDAECPVKIDGSISWILQILVGSGYHWISLVPFSSHTLAGTKNLYSTRPPVSHLHWGPSWPPWSHLRWAPERASSALGPTSDHKCGTAEQAHGLQSPEVLLLKKRCGKATGTHNIPQVVAFLHYDCPSDLLFVLNHSSISAGHLKNTNVAKY